MQRLEKLDYGLLAAALVLGVAATLRKFGVHEVTLSAAAFLCGAALVALRPLVRLFGGGEGIAAHRKAAVAVVFGAHFVATFFFFPPEDVLNERPVLTLDHALHFYQAERAREVFSDSHRFTLYDPYFMAGYPAGMIFDLDSKGVELWCSVLRMLDTARAFKLFIMLVYLLIVFCVYAGCRRLGFTSDESIYALLFLLAYWHWGRPYASHFRFAGMFSYVLGFHLSFYLMGLFKSLLDGAPAKRFYVLGPLAFFVHPTVAVLLPVPFFALLLAARREVRRDRPCRAWDRRVLVRLAAWCVLVTAANAFWLVPFLRYLDAGRFHTGFFQIRGLNGLLGVLLKPGNLPALALFALSAVGCVYLVRQHRFTAAAAPATGGVFLLFLAAFGIFVPLVNQMEPGRFLVPAILFMAPLAGAGAAFMIGELRRFSRGARIVRPVGAVAAIVLLISSPALALLASRAFYRHTLTTTFKPEVSRLIEALKHHTDPDGRLMIEDGPAWAYGDCLLPAILPLQTEVEQIGGPYPYGFLEHHFATFQTCRAFGKPLGELGPERLREYLQLYNVHWILTATAECRARIEVLPHAKVLWSRGVFTLWDVSSASTFASPSGVSVRASYNLIEVTVAAGGVQSTPDRILLKYHWDRGLEVAPPARISPEAQLDDPVPFILLEPCGETDIRIIFR